MEKDESVYLQHILDAIAKIESYLSGVNEAAFSHRVMVQDAVIRHLK